VGHREDIARLIPALRRFAHALVLRDDARAGDVADELVHRVVVAALRAGPQPSPDSLRLWLYTTFINLNHVRLRTHAPASAAPAVQTRSQGLTQSLLELSLEDREVLLLVALEGFSYGQAGEILGISRAALVCRVARARHVLGQHLDVALPFETRRHLRHPTHLRLVQ
jgi:RNA polymerase sigma-70 factor (ECF subfamily)